MDSKVTAVQSDLSQQGVVGEPRVNSRDQFDCGLRAFTAGFVGIQLPFAEVLVHMPYALTTPFGGDAEQARAAFAEANGRQPAGRYQFIPLSDARFKTLDDQRADSVAIEAKTQTKHARMRR